MEVLYRDLLQEYERLQSENHKQLEELRQVSIILSGMPQTLQRAAVAATTHATQGADQQLQLASAALTSAQKDLRQSGQALLGASSRNVWFVGGIASGCGLLGALIGVLLSFAILGN
ncbi:hypothetical protein PT7_0297 [Pusillimonas sp. T7-7]|nr:hypothetical protein PT7_0297 [Pusillimonas sp. T7-7]